MARLKNLSNRPGNQMEWSDKQKCHWANILQSDKLNVFKNYFELELTFASNIFSFSFAQEVLYLDNRSTCWLSVR